MLAVVVGLAVPELPCTDVGLVTMGLLDVEHAVKANAAMTTAVTPRVLPSVFGSSSEGFTGPPLIITDPRPRTTDLGHSKGPPCEVLFHGWSGGKGQVWWKPTSSDHPPLGPIVAQGRRPRRHSDGSGVVSRGVDPPATPRSPRLVLFIQPIEGTRGRLGSLFRFPRPPNLHGCHGRICKG